MQLKIPQRYLIFKCSFFVGLLYVLMRPFLINYVSPYYKYIFMILVVIAGGITLLSKRCVGRIGYTALFWLLISYIYILLNAYFLGGAELFSMSITAYVFYSFPIIIMPLLMQRINWRTVISFASIFGVIDAGISIIEFFNRRQMFPMSGIEGDVGIITKAGTYIVRTYGLQGSYFILAEILCFCGFCAYYLCRFEKSRFHLFSWIIISIGILTTGSRGYYVAYAAGIVVMFFCEHFFDKDRGIKKKTIIIVLSFLLVFFIAGYLIFGTNLTTGNENFDVVLNRIRMVFDWEGDSANVQRVNIWMWAIDYWKESIWVGHGACCTDIRYSGYIKVTESGVLKRLVELGLIGTVIQYITMIIPLRKGIRKLLLDKLDCTSLPFIGIIAAFFIEDFVLERYTAPEYTILLWTAIAYLAYYECDKQSNVKMSGKIV